MWNVKGSLEMEDVGSVKVDSDGFLFQGGSGTLRQI